MKKLLYLCLLTPVFGFGQVFQENWDAGIGNWTLINGDGLTPADDVSYVTDAWVVVDRQGDNNYGGPAGDFAALSTSYYTPSGTSNDWLISPQIDLTGLTHAYLGWDAKAQDSDYPDGYTLRLSTNGGNTIADFTVDLFNTAGENSEWTTRTVDLSNYVGQPIRIAFVNNSTDQFVLLVDNIVVSQDEIVVPITYCTPSYAFIEAISNVDFAGISNITDPTDETTDYEDFTSMSATVSPGESYPIIFEGNTGGDYDDYFSVFFDWNQNGNFNDDGEAYEVGILTNSDGTDAQQVTGTIAVPADALPGNTRMRVVKYFDEYSANACPSADDFAFGQAEDYTVSVVVLGTPSFDKSKLLAYPNPVKDKLNLSYVNNIDEVTVYNLMGQEVLNQKINATSGQLNVSSLSAGSYIVKVNVADTVNTIKIIKQ